jgi:hypothetical protein
MLTAIVCVAILSAQTKSTPLTGAWRVTKVQTTGANARTTSDPQPGLYLFTGSHYSIINVNSDGPRPDLPEDTSKAAAAQLLASWGPFTANSGTYEIKGDTVTFHPIVAKNPALMASHTALPRSFKIEGKTLTLITLTSPGGSSPTNPATVTLTRVE